jgi:hypothetical protein
MPDVVVPRAAVGIADEMQPITSSAVVSVNWKTPTAFAETGKVTAIGRIQAIAFASKRKAVPAFLTDMAAGFRCWIVIDGVLYYLHHDEAPLSLLEGVALIRYFLTRAEEVGGTAKVVNHALCVDSARVAPPPRAQSAFGGRGDGDGGNGGGGEGGAGGSENNDGGKGGGFRARSASGDDDSDTEISPETIRAIAAALSGGGGMRISSDLLI